MQLIQLSFNHCVSDPGIFTLIAEHIPNMNGIPDYTAVMCGLVPYTPGPLSNSNFNLMMYKLPLEVVLDAHIYCGSIIILKLPSHIII